jgi:DNA-binding NtrC family response regulator
MTSPAQSADVLRDIVVADPKMRQVVDFAKKVAPLRADVLITGETGSGKEQVARIIYHYSTRCAKPWVAVNCAALPEYLVESELFGYEKGAFSGAGPAKPGLFEIVDGGTLFLDEISGLEPKVQVKLLRVLDNIPYCRLGGKQKISVDVRVIAGSNRDLHDAVQTGALRRDLYHRITEVQIQVPALRERPRDIAALADHFLQRCCPGTRFTAGALDLLAQREWSGNVRELHSLVLGLAISTTASQITADEVATYVSVDDPEMMPFADNGALNQRERQMIVRALETTGGNPGLAAAQLGMACRALSRKLNHYQITIGHRTWLPAPWKRPTTYQRMELTVPVTMTNNAGRFFSAQTRNLSLAGLGLQQVQPALQAGEELAIHFRFPDGGHKVEVRGIVAWSQPNGLAGIRFADISDSTTEVVRSWMANNRLFLQAGATKAALREAPTAEAHGNCV